MLSLVSRIAHWLTSPQVAFRVCEPIFRLAGRRKTSPAEILPEVRNALVVRLDEIGDVVLTIPLLRELRRNLPAARITLVVAPHVANLLETCPYVNEVLVYECRTEHRRWQRLWQHLSAIEFARSHLWNRRFDLALLPRWDVDQDHSAFVAYFSGAVWRAAYSETVNEQKQRLNQSQDLLLTHALDDRVSRHEIEYGLEMIGALGGEVRETHLELWPEDEDVRFAQNALPNSGTSDYIALCPSGGTSQLKQWPVGNFIQLGRWLQDEHKARLVLIGGAGDETLGAELQRGLGQAAINLIGRTTLRQLAAVLGQCKLFAGNDTGPMHIAAAAGIPVVAVFGSSCHHRFHPWSENHRVVANELPCSPCAREPHRDRCVQCVFDHPKCLHELPIERVMAAINELRAQSGAVKPYSGESVNA